VINFATKLATAAGPRLLVTGFSPTALTACGTHGLQKVPGVPGSPQLMLDGNGVVIASTNPLLPPGYVFHTPAQREVLAHGSGQVSGHYYDQVPLANTTWKLLLAAPVGPLFATDGLLLADYSR